MLAYLILTFKNILKSRLNCLSMQLIGLFLGFFVATIISTIPSQTGDWGILAGAIIVAFNEIISKIIYTFNSNRKNILNIINCIKIGTIYGLFVDAFKLGS